MSDTIPIKLPGSLDSLVKFAIDFEQLKRNLEFIAGWMNSTQQVIQDLQNKVEIDKPKPDFDPKILPKLELNLKLCLKEIETMNGMKDKINSWSDRFLTIEEKYYGLQGIIVENNEEVDQKIEKERENIIQRFDKVKKEVIEEVRDRMKESERSAAARMEKLEDRIRELENSGRDEKFKLEVYEKVKQELLATAVFNVNDPKSTIVISPSLEINSDDPQETFHTEQEDLEALIFSTQSHSQQLGRISKFMSRVSQDGLEFQPSSSPISNSPEDATLTESNPKTKTARRASTQAYSDVANLRAFKDLQLKVYKLEQELQTLQEDRKGFEKKWPELRSLNNLKQEDPDQREDLTHELHLRLITVIEETNNLKALFSNIKPRDAYSDLLRPERVPNFGQYIPFSVRIKKLEELSEELAPMHEIEDLRSSIDELKFKFAKFARVSVEKEYKEEASPYIFSIESSTKNTSILNEFSEIVKPKPNSSNEEKFNDLYSSLNKLFWYLSQKTTRKDVEDLMRTYKPADKEAQSSEGLDWLIEKYKEHESRLITDWNDIKELKKNFKAIDHELREYLAKESKEVRMMLKENYLSNKLEIENRYKLIESKFLSPEDEDQLQNLQSVRLYAMKLQKDMTSLSEKLAELEEKLHRNQNPIPFDSGDEAENSRSDFSLSKISTILKKHETQFNILKNQIAKLHFDMQVSDQKVLKQTEVIHQSNIKELEEMKTSLSDIINKMKEGSKLSHKDVNKLNELYEIIDNKGDKEEILQKVDKNELKKAYRLLSKKIETLQKDLKKAADAQLAQQNREDPYILRTSVGTECLACGQELSKARAKSEAKIWNKMPVHAMKFGPGFSKLLPLIGQQPQESLQARNKSELGVASRGEIVFDESGDTSLRRRDRVLVNTDRTARSNTRN